MAKRLFKSLLQRILSPSRQNSSAGFTLTEVLVVALIAGIIVSGLLYMVVQLLSSDQQEASRSETQREMQMAMDYMATELREAVYVYTGDCLAGRSVWGQPDYCPGLSNYLPASITQNSVPVVAFWKQQEIPTTLRNNCRANNIPQIGGVPVPCVSGSSYALVVYSLSLNNPGAPANPTWRGRARITRYSLEEFNQAGTARNRGYVNPGSYLNGFTTWPIYNNQQNMQAAAGGRPDGSAAVLVDFVDDGRGVAAAQIPVPANAEDLCPNDPNIPAPPLPAAREYNISPPTTMLDTLLTDLPAGTRANARSFFSCVSLNRSDGNTVGSSVGQYRDVILYLRGNAYGRPGVFSDKAFLTTLETRVLTRGVLDRNPSQD